jgi:2-methylisocitrate lyase-like PEP mutase family enzyme
VAANVTAAAATGIAGLSIEDSTGDAARPLYDFDIAVERIRAARAAIDASGSGIVLMARCETYLVGRPDLAHAIERLNAFAAAGADCLYAPGMRDLGEIRTLVEAVAPKPVNVGVFADFATVAQLRDIGVRRISVGGALARTAWSGFLDAAREIAEKGTFTAFGPAVTGVEINKRFGPR